MTTFVPIPQTWSEQGAEGDPTTERKVPSELGRYELEAVLGRGGMGIVYSATLRGQGGFRKRVALKLVDRGRPERLVDEGRLAAKLHHPHVVETYDVGVIDDQVYLAMELVEGPTLSTLGSHGPLPRAAAVEVIRHVALGLAHAHDRGVLHLDVKPSNVIVDPWGYAKLSDFGVSRLVGVGDRRVVGTVGYAAPEVLEGLDADRRADLFGLGCMLVELCTGRPPWPGPMAEYALALSRRSSPDLGRLEGPLAAVARACLEVRREDRIGSATELITRLSAVQAPDPTALVGLVASWAGRPTPAGTSLPSTTPSPTNLVRRRDRFVARPDLLAHLGAALEDSRLVAVVGPGGAGKSRLAAEAALARLDRGPVWHCDLAEARTLADVAGVMVAAAGLHLDPSVDDPMAALTVALVGSPALWLLDGVEHLVDALGAHLTTWASQPGGARFLITSQRRLHAGERVVAVAGLGPEAARALFEARVAEAGAELPDVDIGALVEAVDGLPLPLELASSLARLVPPDRLATILPEAPGRRGPFPDRHRSLSAMVEWSWRGLADWQRAAIAQLSVFHGGFTVDQAQVVLDLSAWPEAPWALLVVEELLDWSLLVSRGRRRDRLTVPRVVASYARRHGEGITDAELRHAELFARLGAEAEIRRRAGPDAARAWDDLVAEHDNLVAALDAAERARRPDLAYGVARALIDTWSARGLTRPTHDVIRRVLAMDSLDEDARMRLLFQEAWSHRVLQRVGPAMATIEAGLEIAGRLGTPRYQGLFETIRADVHEIAGDLDAAAGAAERAVAHLRRAGDRLNLGIALERLGRVACDAGDLVASEAHHAATAEAHRASGFTAGLANAIGNRADVALWLGRLQEALAWAEEARAIDDGERNPRTRCVRAALLASIHLALGDEGRAEAEARGALAHADGTDQAEEVFRHRLVALTVLTDLGRPDLAALRDALAEADQGGSTTARAQARSALGWALATVGQPEEALQLLDQAVGMSAFAKTRVEAAVRRARVLEQLGRDWRPAYEEAAARLDAFGIGPRAPVRLCLEARSST